MKYTKQLQCFWIYWLCILNIGWSFDDEKIHSLSPALVSRELQSTVTQSGQTLTVSFSDTSASSSTTADVVLFESSCNDTLPDNEIVSMVSVDVSPPIISYVLAIDGDDLGNSSIVSLDSATSGSIEFCVGVDLIENNNILSTKHTSFNISFDLQGTEMFLDTTAGTIDENLEVNLDIDLSVTACECDADFNCFASPQTYTYELAAPVFRICLTPSSDDVRISNMDLLMSSSDLSYTYEPVSFGINEEDVDELTTISEQGNIKMVKTRIVYGLFADGNTGVVVSGSVFASDLNGKTEDFATYTYEIKVIDNSQKSGCFFNLFRLMLGLFR